MADREAVEKMKIAGEIPAYQQMMDYLMTRRAVPEIRTRYLGDRISGVFTTGGDTQPAGKIGLNYNSSASTLVHEITHAADRQISNQYSEEKYPPNAMWAGVGRNQFTDAYEKLTYSPTALRDDPKKNPIQNLMKLMAPDWTKSAADYRSTAVEARAWGVENAAVPFVDPNSRDRAPAHIDSTLATEMMILLDLAQRSMKTRPASQGR